MGSLKKTKMGVSYIVGMIDYNSFNSGRNQLEKLLGGVGKVDKCFVVLLANLFSAR